MKKTQHTLSDSILFDMFREFCASDEDCNRAIEGAKKARVLLGNDKLFRSYSFRKEGL
jgi:hypothetical protein